MLPTIDFETFRFAEPLYLRLLAVPGALLGLWVWRLIRRRADIRHLRRRMVPIRERFPMAGDLAFWLCVIAAASLCIVALARPEARISAVSRASADVVILQDGSASMHVADVKPDRWRRSVQFLRAFAEALSWKGDRVALALFAQLAAPQVRLTRDPNALFFFIDHLGERSPFPLENLPTWDTNIEEGIRWGLRLVETDEQLFGRSGNPKMFLVISDGQAWSGRVADALRAARARRIPVYVVGVGTTIGGLIPEPIGPDGTRPPSTIRSVLDRESLVQIAVAGGGEYFELGHEPDRDVAFRIIERLRSHASVTQLVERYEDLYWRVLLVAALLLCLGTVLLYHRAELLLQTAGAAAVVILLAFMVAG